MSSVDMFSVAFGLGSNQSLWHQHFVFFGKLYLLLTFI